MSGLEPLVPFIYHEKQQPGSQLCAQHSLNTILQGDFFSAPDLAQFAQQLDTLEGSFNDDAGSESNNMDDTGFFSVMVLERALRVWGFTIVPWRSEELRGRHEKPHEQMAFLLNHEQHWFSLRRFGSLEDPDNGHWFNLNSFLDKPEWVGRLYLGMVLSQAEDEGYSVFAVLPTRETPDGPTTLPHTEADDVASRLPQPTSSTSGAHLSTSHVSSSSSVSPVSGFEHEDFELQAALQASLTGRLGEMGYAARAAYPHSYPQPSPASHPSSSSHLSAHFDTPENASPAENHDPIAASMARSKAIMQRMLREQEMALREGYEEEVATRFGDSNSATAPLSTRHIPSRGETEEEEALRSAIEESRRDISHDTGETIDGSDENYEPAGVYAGSDDDVIRRVSPTSGQPTHPVIHDLSDRVYDDEDSELQAALKASLEAVPDSFHIPLTPPRAVHTSVRQVSDTNAQPERITPAKNDEEGQVGEEPNQAEEIDAQELRRRRLARFGGQP